MRKTLLLACAAFALGIAVGWVLFRGGIDKGAAGQAHGTGPPRPIAPRSAETPAAPGTAPAGPAAEGAGTPEVREALAPSSHAGPIAWERNRLRAAVRAALLDGFRKRADRPLPEAIVEASTDRLLAELERSLGTLPDRAGAGEGHRLAARELLRDRAGTVAEPVDILLQLRGHGRGGVGMIPIREGGTLDPRILAAVPLDVETPVGVGSAESMTAFARGGVLPQGTALVVERVDLVVTPGVAPHRRPGGADLSLGGNALFERGDATSPMRVAWKGAVLLRAGQEEGTFLRVEDGAAEARLRGRLIPEGEATTFRQEVLALVEEECSGFLAGGRILLQVISDGGGGNPREVRLDGTPNIYLREMAAENLERRASGPREFRGDLGYAEGAGPIPPSRRLVVFGGEVRGRFLGRARRGGVVEVQIGGNVVFRETQDPERVTPEFTGTWSGEFTVFPGSETRTFVRTDTGAFAEVVLRTELR